MPRYTTTYVKKKAKKSKKNLDISFDDAIIKI